MTEDSVLDVVEKVLQSPQSSHSTRDYAINAVMKLSIRSVLSQGFMQREGGVPWDFPPLLQIPPPPPPLLKIRPF